MVEFDVDPIEASELLAPELHALYPAFDTYDIEGRIVDAVAGQIINLMGGESTATFRTVVSVRSRSDARVVLALAIETTAAGTTYTAAVMAANEVRRRWPRRKGVASNILHA